MSDERFKNRRKAWQWLVENGFTVSEKKFYNDCDAGLVAVAPDKTVSKFSVAEYGRKLKTPGGSVPATFENSAKKEALEIEKLQLDVDKRKLENRKEDSGWLKKDDAYAQMAGLIGVLRDSLRHQFQIGQTQLIHLAGGDHSRGPELYEGCEELLARGFNELLHTGRIQTLFIKDDEA